MKSLFFFYIFWINEWMNEINESTNQRMNEMSMQIFQFQFNSSFSWISIFLWKIKKKKKFCWIKIEINSINENEKCTTTVLLLQVENVWDAKNHHPTTYSSCMRNENVFKRYIITLAAIRHREGVTYFPTPIRIRQNLLSIH